MRNNNTIHSDMLIRLAVRSGDSDGGRDDGGGQGSVACRSTCVTTIGDSELDVDSANCARDGVCSFFGGHDGELCTRRCESSFDDHCRVRQGEQTRDDV
eukprot:scaffold31709_cov41-Cyclotella_meneghiniana.AAC.2